MLRSNPGVRSGKKRERATAEKIAKACLFIFLLRSNCESNARIKQCLPTGEMGRRERAVNALCNKLEQAMSSAAYGRQALISHQR